MLAFLTSGLVTTGMLSAASLTAEANPFCLVENLRTTTTYSDLQLAINDATNADTLTVKGVCFGNFTVDGKTLTFRGVKTPARRYPTLDGVHTGTVLTIENQAAVTITNLSITHGYATGGGGLSILFSTATLKGSTRVLRNEATSRGGGINCAESQCSLNDSVRVNLNTAPNGGGVVIVLSTLTMNDASRINRNGAGDSGGGVYIDEATLVMNVRPRSSATWPATLAAGSTTSPAPPWGPRPAGT